MPICKSRRPLNLDRKKLKFLVSFKNSGKLSRFNVWFWLILKVKVKVMHKSTLIISQTVIDKANIAIAKKLEVILKFSAMHILTMNISKVLMDRTNITTAIKYEVICRLSIGIFRFDFGLF